MNAVVRVRQGRLSTLKALCIFPLWLAGHRAPRMAVHSRRATANVLGIGLT
jgi:hypothetical protein